MSTIVYYIVINELRKPFVNVLKKKSEGNMVSRLFKRWQAVQKSMTNLPGFLREYWWAILIGVVVLGLTVSKQEKPGFHTISF